MTREEAIQELELKRTAAKSILDSLPPKTREKSALNDDVEMLTMAIEALSQPERPKGRWVCLEAEIGYYACSECDHRILRAKCNYCPNCGADMAELPNCGG